MATTIAQVRAAVRDAYQAASLPAHVHAAPPSAIVPPAVAVVPGDPYFDPSTIGDQVHGHVTLRVTVFASLADAESALDELERLATTAMVLLPDGHTVGALSRPSRVPLDESGDRWGLSAFFETTTRTTPL